MRIPAVSRIAWGEWENNPDCCTAVISPDALNKGIILMGESAYVHKVDAVFPVLHGAPLPYFPS